MGAKTGYYSQLEELEKRSLWSKGKDKTACNNTTENDVVVVVNEGMKFGLSEWITKASS